MAHINSINYYQRIGNEYGHTTRQTMKSYAKNNRKLGNMMSRKSFLVRCRRTGVTPSHITNSFRCIYPLLERNSPFLRELQRCINRFQRSLLNIEIKQTYHDIESLQSQLNVLKDGIIRSLPMDIAQNFLSSQESFYASYLASKTSKTKRKYERIVANTATHCNTELPTLNARAIHNATNVALPHETQIMLSLGPKFALPFTSLSQVPFYHIIADLENVLRSTPDTSIRDRNRCAVTNVMQNFIHNFGTNKMQDPLSSFLTHASKITSRFTKENSDIIITESDKGKQSVVMYENDYNEKMLELLSDTNTYKVAKGDPTEGFQRKNNNIVDRLQLLGLIDDSTSYQLRSRSPQCPRIYGLPKAHKQNLPLRPVVPNINTPSYMLSKFVGRIIQASINSRYNIRDSFSFCDYINTVRLPEGYVLVSFDVVSLFTCIPRGLVEHTIIECWADIKRNTDINLDLFIEVTMFCVSCSYFSYRGKYYKQIEGTAMGNPLSPTVADLVMEMLLNNVMSKIDFPVPVMKKYVDDLILALPEDKVNEVLQMFNDYSRDIQFTHEREVNNRIPYLDMVLVRLPDQSIKTEWYCKPIASGRFLDYLSCHPLHMKMNMATNFVSRVRKLDTNRSPSALNNIIDQHLRLNHYPPSLRHRLINRCPERDREDHSEQHQDITFKPMVQVNNLSCRLAKALSTDFPNIRLAMRNEYTIGRLFTQTKDRIPTELRNNVIYRIPCSQCDASYVGLTTTTLKKRISHHKSDINKLDALTNNNNDADDYTSYELGRIKEKTALLHHSADYNHRFALEKTEILDYHRRRSALPVLEVCHIINTEKTVNKRSDCDSLSTTYAGILHTLRNSKSKQTNRQITQNQTNTNPLIPTDNQIAPTTNTH